MSESRVRESLIFGISIVAALLLFGWQVSSGLLAFKSLDRTVTVKGLSEREVPADIAIWRISFSDANNDFSQLYSSIQTKNDAIVNYLLGNGFVNDEITIAMPDIEDLQTRAYLDPEKVKYRFTGNSSITVYTEKVDSVKQGMKDLVDFGREGLPVSGAGYRSSAEFIFTGLNGIKPDMIEEATRNAREVAQKFAEDSESKLGKIRSARQGQFSISDRDSNTPYIKKVRVVSTLEYYLSD
jgi:hypothetical protein